MKYIILLFLAVMMTGCAGAGLGTVAKVKGSAKINGASAAAGMKIQQGSIIDVSKDGFVDISLAGGHMFRLAEGTATVRIADSSVNIDLVFGKLYSSVGKLTGSSAYSVGSPTALAGVRGTKFLFEESSSNAYICVCEGVVSVSSTANTSNVKAVAKDMDIWVRKGYRVRAPKRSPDMSKMTGEVFMDMGLATETNK